MTYRMLLVDDEPTVTDWLHYLLTETFGADADVCRFNEPVQAMRFIGENAFDIAVLDINMPVHNGMEMLEAIRAHRPEARVIFLTGYEQFEYAKQAVNRQVAAYVLKNEEDDVLLAAVRGAMEDIAEACRRRQLMDLAQRRLDASAPVLRREYLMRLLLGQAAGGAPVKLCIDEGAPLFLLCCAVARAGGGEPPALNEVFAAGLAVEEALERNFLYESVMTDDAGWAWLLQPHDGSAWSAGSAPPLRSVIEEAQRNFHRQTGCNLCFLHAAAPAAVESLAAAYRELRAMRALAPAGAHAVLTDADRTGGTASEPAAAEPPLEAAQELAGLLERGERESFLALLRRTTAPLALSGDPSDPRSHEIFLAVSSMFLAHINKTGLADALPAGTVQKLCLADLHGSWSGAASFYGELAGLLFNRQNTERESRAEKYAQKAKRYIEEHLDEDLSLISVADRVMLNPSYFSSLFKETTGTNLSDFIKAARLKRARTLLAEGRYRINEIARMTGYANPAYFTRFFRNETGMSPLEYRNGAT